MKYTYLGPIFIYLELCFDGFKSNDFNEKIEISAVKNKFYEITAGREIENIYEDKDGVQYSNYPFSFVSMFSHCVKVIREADLPINNIFESNYFSEQALLFLFQRADDGFCATMKKMTALFYGCFRSKLSKFDVKWNSFKLEKDVIVGILEHFTIFIKFQNNFEKNDVNENISEGALSALVKQREKVDGFFEKNKTTRRGGIINMLKNIQDTLFNLEKVDSNDHYTNMPVSLLEVNVKTLAGWLKNIELCGVNNKDLLSDEHVIATRHFIYFLVFKVIKSIASIEAKGGRGKLNKNSSLGSKNNKFYVKEGSVFSLELNKDCFFYNFLLIATKETSNKKIINEAIGAFVELIAKKYERGQYGDEIVNVFKLDGNVKNNKNHSENMFVLLMSNYPEHYNVLKDKMLEVAKKTTLIKNNSITGSSVVKNSNTLKDKPLEINKKINSNNNRGNDKTNRGKPKNQSKTSGSEINNKFSAQTEVPGVFEKVEKISERDEQRIKENNDLERKSNSDSSFEKITCAVLKLEDSIINPSEKENLIEKVERQQVEETKGTSSNELELKKQLELIKQQLLETQEKNQMLKEQNNQVSEENQMLKEQSKQTSEENQMLIERVDWLSKENYELRQQTNHLFAARLNLIEQNTHLSKENKQTTQLLSIAKRRLSNCERVLIRQHNRLKTNRRKDPIKEGYPSNDRRGEYGTNGIFYPHNDYIQPNNDWRPRNNNTRGPWGANRYQWRYQNTNNSNQQLDQQDGRKLSPKSK